MYRRDILNIVQSVVGISMKRLLFQLSIQNLKPALKNKFFKVKEKYFVAMENPIIEVQQGRLRGSYESNIRGVKFFAFRGIPYGKAPIGELRFKDPKPVEPWSDLKDATKYGNKCPQIDLRRKNFSGNEDCLCLNVYTKELKSSVPKAVMVWIHGGCYLFGDASDMLYGPDFFVEKDVVLVTINYRLGVLGFLNLDDEEAPGNQGLKDLVLALKWVQQNIANFGGDPNNVTIFGQSSGAALVHYLCLSPLGQGLFHKAIMQSGVAVNPWASLSGLHEGMAVKLSSAMGQKITDHKKLVQFLRTVDARQLAEAEHSLFTQQVRHPGIFSFVPSVDKKSENPFMPMPINEAAKTGIKVPCIFGYNSDDGMFFVAKMANEKFNHDNMDLKTMFSLNIKRFLNENNMAKQEMIYIFFESDKLTPEMEDKISTSSTVFQFLTGIHGMIAVQQNTTNVPTYLYKFEYTNDDPIQQKLFNINLKGTCHSEDLHYLFCPKLFKLIGKKVVPGSTESLISQRFVELWTNFAKTGNPTPETTELLPIKWQPIEKNSIEYNCLKISEDLSMIKDTNIVHQIRSKY